MKEEEEEGELDEDIEEDDLALLGREAGGQPLFVLPLYSLLSQERQNRSGFVLFHTHISLFLISILSPLRFRFFSN